MKTMVLVLILVTLFVSSEAAIPSNFTNIIVDQIGAATGAMGWFNGPYQYGVQKLKLSTQAMYDVVALADGDMAPILCHPNKLVISLFLRLGSETGVKTAMIYAAYRAAVLGFNNTIATTVLDSMMTSKMGFATISNVYNLISYEGIGNTIGRNYFIDSLNDGVNQPGNISGSTGPYSDYTDYQPVNPPMLSAPNLGSVGNCSQLNQNHYQYIVNSFGVAKWPVALFASVRPFAQPIFPVEPPNKKNTNTHDLYLQDYQIMADVYANFNDTYKAIAYYYASGVNKGKSSNWGVFLYYQLVQDTIINANLNYKESAKLLVAFVLAAMDGEVTTHINKRFWDVARPNIGMQCLYGGQTINTWLGSYKGVGPTDGSNWLAFNPIIQNPSPEYPCQHCLMFGTSTQILREFFGDDVYRGSQVVVPEGVFPLDKKITAGNPGYIANVTDVPNTGAFSTGYAPANDIPLSWSTLTQWDTLGATSRIYVGAHTYKSKNVGLKTGQEMGKRVWTKIKDYFDGRLSAKCRNVGSDWLKTL